MWGANGSRRGAPWQGGAGLGGACGLAAASFVGWLRRATLVAVGRRTSVGRKIAVRSDSAVPTGRARAVRIAALTATITLAGLLGSGCRAQRELVVTSEPVGASVRVDDELIGQTPLVLPFIHYGVRRVTLYLDGFQTRTILADISPPWYGTFPADILTEILVPVGWHDQHALHVVLEPGEDDLGGPTLRSVFERAEALRRAGPDGPRDLPPPPVMETRVGDPAQVAPPIEPAPASGAPAVPPTTPVPPSDGAPPAPRSR